MPPAVAIVGMACRYPDARSPEELWENVLARRRAFRRIPPERLNLADYGSADPHAPDRTYATHAAVLDDYTFDRVRFRVSGDTYRSVDLAHWLALDVAARALADAGFADAEGLPRETTGVHVGNTLTGEFSRAGVMRLRWPYVRRVLDAALAGTGLAPDARRALLETVEAQYKAPFPPVDTETLAGGLSNTIAGRICNYFDLKGGGYTVDGACAASLLAVIHACTAVAAGDLDVALAGGVDLSLDPFELVGFARVGALAREAMRVYDARSEGFWPGEGCGFVVLMRHDEALREGRPVYAVLRGWGISSDGSGGITRPEVEGQMLAVRRAWQRAGWGVETAALFEGHGTGTPVGDATELRVLSRLRREAGDGHPPAAIGSVKANVGHTKAAAGVAGLLKAALALHHQVVPPATGCDTPHAELAGPSPALETVRDGRCWPPERPLRAGVSAMGFGGINTHVVLESPATERRAALSPRERTLLASPQDAELFVLGAADAAGLLRQVEHLRTLAPGVSLAELSDLAAALTRTLDARAVRAAVVADTPGALARHLETLAAWLAAGTSDRLEPGVCLGSTATPPRLGFLFPGQGSPSALDGGLWRRRFAAAGALYAAAPWPADADGVATDVAQPAIVTASLAALRVLHRLGLEACVAVGHSLGELTGLCWAGALDEQALLHLAAVRGRAMADLGAPTGAMAGIAASPAAVAAWCDGLPVVPAGLNGPEQTVISGDAGAVDVVVARAQAAGVRAQRLRVSHAFHSPLVAAAAGPLAAHLARHPLRPLRRRLVSTVTGAPLTAHDDPADLLVRQVTGPVRFTEAIAAADPGVDLWVEVGPGQVLTGLARAFVQTPIVATQAGETTLHGLLQAVAAAYALGAPVRPRTLFDDRFTRPFRLDGLPAFLASPCEQAPATDPAAAPGTPAARPVNGHAARHEAPPPAVAPPRDDAPAVGSLLRELIARRAELPLDLIRDTDRLLGDLHLNSITVSELVNEAARRLRLSPTPGPTAFADTTVAALAAALEERVRVEGEAPAQEPTAPPPGVAAWIRPFTTVLEERPRPAGTAPGNGGNGWQVFAPEGYPLRDALEAAFAAVAGTGVVVGLRPGDVPMGLLLDAARAALAAEGPCRFVLVQHGGGAAAFARTVHQELPHVTACVVDVPPGHPEAPAWVVAEALAADDYVEACYDASGVRREPRLHLLPLDDAPAPLPLGPADVLLVTGGGKGITAACAHALARETGARLVLLGRSRPEADAELSATLDAMTADGVTLRYVAADVTDAGAVRAAVEAAEAAFGPVTAVLHGAARNVPRRLASLDEATVRSTLAPKVDGLRHVLAAVDPARLRLLVTFGSIIARMGLPGEADYALANEVQTRLTEGWQHAHPHCRCLAVEWSIWSDVGMGARLGSLDALASRGITPIPPEAGTALLHDLLARPTPVAVVVTGRFGEPSTLRVARPELPFLRFIETPRVYYPGVELVVDAALSCDTDPYLDDHVLQGERLLPAVMGLEAMAQAARALTGRATPPVFEDVAFLRPVVVPPGGPATIRLAACTRTDGTVDVVLRCGQTAFQADHFRARCRFDTPVADRPVVCRVDPPAGDVDPAGDLYGSLLFHKGRFRRLKRYHLLRAKACLAELDAPVPAPWFGRYLPPDLLLGDPGARDAALHAIQACIPHATILPTGLERLTIMDAVAASPRFVHAHERWHDGDTFVYDVAVTDGEGRLLERWDGLHLRRVGTPAVPGAWPAGLLAPYLERRLEDLMPAARVSVALMHDGAATRRARSDRALRQALGTAVPLRRRPTGKPDAGAGRHVSAAHCGALALAVAGPGPLGCDVEPVRPRPEAAWRDLLGDAPCDLARLVARETAAGFDEAATRVWTALECLKKAGAPASPLTLDAALPDGWVVLRAGPLRAATWAARVREEAAAPLVLAVAASPAGAEAPAAAREDRHPGIPAPLPG